MLRNISTLWRYRKVARICQRRRRKLESSMNLVKMEISGQIISVTFFVDAKGPGFLIVADQAPAEKPVRVDAFVSHSFLEIVGVDPLDLVCASQRNTQTKVDHVFGKLLPIDKRNLWVDGLNISSSLGRK